MKIAVCVNHVPDTATKIKINTDNKGIDPTGVQFIINPYDEFAVEEALKLKDKTGDEIIVISLGGDSHKETIRKALAMGADNGILLKTEGLYDSVCVAKILAAEIKEQGCDLVFMGKQSVDYDDGIVGQLTAGFLDYACITIVVDFKLDAEKIVAEREIEGGREIVETSLPAVITTQKGLNEPRYASLKGIMAAKKKTIAEKQVNPGEVLSEIIQLKKPAPKSPGRVLGTDASVVPELVRLLREEAKVI
jgi:electron transfer flavoprotein beta subunit